jgi:hypothetical protein
MRKVGWPSRDKTGQEHLKSKMETKQEKIVAVLLVTRGTDHSKCRVLRAITRLVEIRYMGQGGSSSRAAKGP